MKKYVIALILMTALPVFSQSTPILAQRAKIEADTPAPQRAAALSAFDSTITMRFGATVLSTLQAADANGSPLQERQVVEAQTLKGLYLSGDLPESGLSVVQWKWLPDGERSEVIDFIAGKQTITLNDMRAVEEFARKGESWPQLIPRVADILPLYPENEMERYIMKYKRLGTNPIGFTTVHLVMSPEELMKVTTGVLSSKQYVIIRDEVLARATGSVRRKLRNNNQGEDQAAFDAAMTPIVAALNTPLWNGLQAATAGLDVSFPAQNYTELVEKVIYIITQLDNGTYKTVKNSAGSIMLVKGATAYTSWAANYTLD